MPHRRPVPESERLDPLAGSNLGILVLIKTITREQYDAGVSYERIVARYRISICAPNPLRGARDMLSVTGKQSNVDAGDEDKRRTEYNETVHTLTQHAGRRGLVAVNQLVIHNEMPHLSGLKDLINGLSALAAHFRLTSRGRSANR
jgi:hypothetical protein